MSSNILLQRSVQFTSELAHSAVRDNSGGPFGLVVKGEEMGPTYVAWIDLPNGQRAEPGDWIIELDGTYTMFSELQFKRLQELIKMHLGRDTS